HQTAQSFHAHRRIGYRAAAGKQGASMTDKAKPGEHNPIGRRRFLLGASTAVAAGVAPTAAAQAQQQGAPAAAAAASGSEPTAYLTLTEAEAAFFAAVANTMIPADELTPSGTECGIVIFIDRQLASAWGGGAKMYRNGPRLRQGFRPARSQGARGCAQGTGAGESRAR